MTEQNGQRAPVDKVCGYEYTVKRGDSFYLIAHRLGVPLRDLLEANSEVNPARLMVGDVLCIPMEEDDRPQEAAPAPAPEAAPAPAPETVPAPAPVPEATPTPEAAEPEPAPDVAEPVPEEDEPEEDESTPEELEMPAMPPEPEPTPEPISEPAPMAQAPERTPAIQPPERTPAAEAPEARQPACVAGRAHVVQAGETVTDIQMSANVNLHTLEIANPDRDFTALAAGDEICVPDENIPCDVLPTYTLRTDDTLESVALRHNLSVGALLRANPCLAPGDFVAGVTVLLGDA